MPHITVILAGSLQEQNTAVASMEKSLKAFSAGNMSAEYHELFKKDPGSALPHHMKAHVWHTCMIH